MTTAQMIWLALGAFFAGGLAGVLLMGYHMSQRMADLVRAIKHDAIRKMEDKP